MRLRFALPRADRRVRAGVEAFRSLGIASVVAVFTGLVMAVQFAYGLQKFGGIEYTGRIVGMPILAAFALVLGFAGAMFITSIEFGLPPGFFLQTALASVRFSDYFSGTFKTPFFRAITALLGCHFGLVTRGGTEGMGNSTTRSVVAISISILISDFLLTKISLLIWPSS